MDTKRRKKHEKHKKHKKVKRRKEKHSTSESESGSDSMEWVEAPSSSSTIKQERDEWMEDDTFVPTYSRSKVQLKSSRRQKSEEAALLEKKILAERELNPYWKDSGQGVPSSSSSKVKISSLKLPSHSVGDGGYSWLKKAYQRVKEQAKEEGRTMEDVAAERWGSLKKLEDMLKEAEGRMQEGQHLSYKRSTPELDDYVKDHSEKEHHQYGRSRVTMDSQYHCKKYLDSDKHSYQSSRHRTCKERQDQHDIDNFTQHRSKGKGDESDNAKNRHRSYKNDFSDKFSYHSKKEEQESSSSKLSARFMAPSDKEKHSFSKSDDFTTHSHHASWKKKSYDREKRDSSKLDDPITHSYQPPWKKKDYDKHDSSKSDDSIALSHQPSWKKKDYDREKHDSSKLDDSIAHAHQPSWKKKDYDREKHDSSKSDDSIAHSHQPSWKKKDYNRESSRNFAEGTACTSSIDSEIKYHSQENPELQNIKTVDQKATSKGASSSSADSSSDDEPSLKPSEEVILNQNELNYLGASVLRAKLESDNELASRIEKDLALEKSKRTDYLESGEKIYDGRPREEVMMTKIDCYPLPKSLQSKFHKKHERHRRNIYVGPMKTKHFDDDQTSIKHIFEREKMSTIDDQMKMYFAAASTSKESLNDECDADVSGKIEKKMSTYPSQAKDMQRAIQDHKKLSSALSKCRFCLDQPALLHHTIIAKGNEVFLCAPPYKSLVEGHCFIVPVTHVTSTLLLDENEYSEIQAFKKGLVKMFSDQKMTMVFMETSFRHKYYPHAAVECIPMPKETGELAPLYFKKAIDESEYEWANNKKLIDLSKKSVRNSVPKALPFFSVEFGLNGGYAHIIEDEKRFPHYFGREIVGGMLEIDSYDIVKERRETTQEINKKVLKLVDMWWKYKEYFTC